MDPTTTDGAEELRRRILDHYDRHRRDLPWRDDGDPYRIWVSEVMLQQTRVETAIPYYRRWMERFPGVAELARADQEEVLQAWKGLGYYSRARNLHRAARLVRERFEGAVPDSVEGLRELPGVGPYTAGAVASIAFGRAVAAVDGNVRRVLSRIFDLEAPTGAGLRERAAGLVDPERPGCWNQALMDLGATVCTPSKPDCPICPARDRCLARARGTVAERPPPRKRTPVERRTSAVAVLLDSAERTLLTRRPDEGLLGGMWEFPSVELEMSSEGGDAGVGDAPAGDAGGSDSRRSDARLSRAGEAARERVERLGAVLPSTPALPLGTVDHRFTHLHVTYLPLFVRGADLAGVVASGQTRVVGLDALDDHPLPVAQQKIGERARRAARAPEGHPGG